MSQYNTLGISRIPKIVEDSSGVGAKRVVAYGNSPNTVKNVSGANAGNLAGVTWDRADDNGAVALAEYGYPEIESAGEIPYGSKVNVADAAGRIKAVDEADATVVTLVGVAEEAATGEGQRVKVNVRLFGLVETV